MATMKMPLRVEGEKVLRWDYPTRAWVTWKGDFKATEMGMRGMFRIRNRRGKLALQRWSEKGLLQWEKELPQGISTWDALGGGLHSLPWEENDHVLRVLGLLGIPPELLVRQGDDVAGVTLHLTHGRLSSGQKFYTYVETDGVKKVTDHGVEVRGADYAIVHQHHVKFDAYQEARWVQHIYVWPKVSPQILMKGLLGIGLSHSMQPWLISLHREKFSRPK